MLTQSDHGRAGSARNLWEGLPLLMDQTAVADIRIYRAEIMFRVCILLSVIGVDIPEHTAMLSAASCLLHVVLLCYPERVFTLLGSEA